VLGDQDRLEAAVTVTRHVDPDRAAIGDDRLVERQHQILHLGRRHRPLDQLI